MASMLWRTSFILRVLSPLSLDHDFRHLRLLTYPRDDDLQLDSSAFSNADHHLLLQWLCISLSRAAAAKTSTMAAPFCVAFPSSLTSISVVFPAARTMEMKHSLQHFLATFSEIKLDCTPEEDFSSGSAMENVLLCGLRAALLCDGWTVFEDNLALHGGVSKEGLDGTLTETVAFSVRIEANDCIDFVLSPDVIRFRPFKIERLLIGPLKNWFDDGAVVAFDDYLENFSPDDILEMKCLVLPSMQEGFVSGCCKALPMEINLSKQKEIWNKKHGLVLFNEDFYIRVSFPFEGSMIGSWFPSCLVLKSSGLIPALPSIRAARTRSIITKVTSSISRWDFFSFGKLKLKSIPQAVKDTQSSWWTSANLILQTSQIGLSDSNFEHDSNTSSIEADALLSCFRRPKLPSCHYSVSKSSEPSVSNMPGTNNWSIPGHSAHSKNPTTASSPTGFRIPVFSKRKIRDVGVGCRNEVKQKLPLVHKTSSCMEQGESSTKKCQQGDSKIIAADSFTVISIPKKRALVRSQPSMQKLQNPPAASKAAHAKSEPSNCAKLSPQEKLLLANDSMAEQAASKLKDQNAVKAPTSRQKKSAGGEDVKAPTSRQKKSTGGEKKSTITTIEPDANKNKVLSKHAEGKLSDLTVPELKLFLCENKTKVSGKKEELVQRVVLLLSSPKKA